MIVGQDPAPAPSASDLRVLIVDDSAIIRAMIGKRISETEGLRLVSSLANGEMAVNYMKNNIVDVVILDLEMPVMDGMTALPKILELSPATRVIIVSTLSFKNAEVSIRAMQMGATDYIAKPTSHRDKESAEPFFRELITKIKAVGKPSPRPSASPTQGKFPARLEPEVPVNFHLPEHTGNRIVFPTFAPQALAIASSTGGPQALLYLFKELKPYLRRVPIFITQHMPATFTKILAQHLSEASGRDCHEGIDGEVIQPGKIYLAPGEFHMVPQMKKGQLSITLNNGPEVNYCRPAADPMIDGLVELYGNKLLLTVLTGMGSDGLGGARNLNTRGGFVVAQDEASSVVWGMPKAVVEHNIAKNVLSLQAMPAYLIKAFGEQPL